MDKKDISIADKLTTVLILVYLAALYWILLFKLGVHFSYMENRRVNFIPFGDAFVSNGKIDIAGVVLNVVIFAPLGIYTGVLFKRWAFLNKVLFFSLVSFMFEGLQFVFKIGAFDITDIVTNVLGGMIGLLIFRGIKKIFNNGGTQRFINIIGTVGTILMISFLVLLKLNMLPIRYQ